MHKISWLLIISIIPTLVGCELLSMRSQNKEMERRIVLKEQELVHWETQNRQLLEKKERLQDSLDNNTLTSEELFAKLENLRKENANLETYNGNQKKRKLEREIKIQEYQNEITAIKENDDMRNEEKTKRIATLQQQIRDYLEIITEL